MKLYPKIIVFFVFILFISCEKSDIDKGLVAFGADWSKLNCGQGTSKVYINDRYEGELFVSVDAILDCYSSGVLTFKKPVGEYKYEVVFNDDCSLQSGYLNIYKDSCTKIMVKF